MCQPLLGPELPDERDDGVGRSRAEFFRERFGVEAGRWTDEMSIEGYGDAVVEETR